MKKTDFIVVGTGIAGLSFALKAAKFGKVILITKESTESSSSFLAQGGIASVLPKNLSLITDSVKNHISDTLQTGQGLCKSKIVKKFIQQGEKCINELSSYGILFDKEGKNYSLGIEAGHSARRIIHHKDSTGKAIILQLLEKIQEHKNIELLENHSAIQIITTSNSKNLNKQTKAYGIYTLKQKTKEIFPIFSTHSILATGGCGKAYLYTSNPSTATGDGVSLAWQAGARITNMEFIQFHPTCFFNLSAKKNAERKLLISEAMRGEGANLILEDGKEFMHLYDKRISLAPRDIVARAIKTEMNKRNKPCVYLDISKVSPHLIEKRFSYIYKKLLSEGFDCKKDPIPVIPAAHYQCGGISTNPYGETSIKGLYAIGEVACNGFHGANRLASNSLLESYLSATSTIEKILAQKKKEEIPSHLINQPTLKRSGKLPSLTNTDTKWDKIRETMWQDASIIRNEKRMKYALSTLEEIITDIEKTPQKITKESTDLFNLAISCRLIIQSALKRKESRGVHYRSDYPKKSFFFLKETTLNKKIY